MPRVPRLRGLSRRESGGTTRVRWRGASYQSPSLSRTDHSRLCHLRSVQSVCRVNLCASSSGAALQASGAKSCMHATEGAIEVRRARRRLREAATDERVGLFTPDKDGYTHTRRGRVPVLGARRGTVCGEVGRVPRFPQLTVRSLYWAAVGG